MPIDEGYKQEVAFHRTAIRLGNALVRWLDEGRPEFMNFRLYELRIQKKPTGFFMIAKCKEEGGYRVSFGEAKDLGAVVNFLNAVLKGEAKSRPDKFPPVKT